MAAHHIKISTGEKKFCTLCGVSNFEEGCKFTIDIENKKLEIESKKIEVEKEIESKKIEVENKKLIYGNIYVNLRVSFIYFLFIGAVSTFVVYIIAFIFIAVIYFGFDGLKMQISRLLDECRKGGWLAAISHIFRRR